MPDCSVRLLERAGDYLQQSRFAASVWPNDTDYRAFLELKRDVLQGPEFLMAPQSTARQRFFQAIARSRVGSILLRNIVDQQGGNHGRKCSRNLRRKTDRAGAVSVFEFSVHSALPQKVIEVNRCGFRRVAAAQV